eukprot:CAMPEP_0202692148 /NCGR_PEP_ID=MMETSP1385-20130828/6606_1 /ASSEMBLY_ACC=CAM_ASM_000861 /TAXON_ID=933848 /ORGANISM="Elphidium margaritaceum" /LENGTH=307 /DNA_ID=CAMNT_0049347631 /DNA_START=87 /DNA_END=1010 /DNA_ORIENTATION=-
MFLKKTSTLLAVYAINLAYSQSAVCNSANGMMAIDTCVEISDDGGAGEVGSVMFSCSATGTAVYTSYADNACTTEYMSFEDANMAITCDGVDSCPTMSITNYFSTDCTPTGVSQIVPVVLGCVAGIENLPGYSVYIQCNGADGAVAILYDDDECNGNQVAAMLGETGCSSDGSTYEEFSCSGDTPRDYDVDLLDESFNDFEATEVREMNPRRRRTKRPRRPRSTITAQDLFAMDKFIEHIQAGKEKVVEHEEVGGSSIQENVVMMLGVFALVVVMAVYFCGRMKKDKGLMASENTVLLPASYGAVNA